MYKNLFLDSRLILKNKSYTVNIFTLRKNVRDESITLLSTSDV